MSLSKRSTSRQDILSQRQQATFVGRASQLDTFRHNLILPPEDWCFLFNISGQGGVGKSTLLKQFHGIVEKKNFVVASTDEAEDNLIKVMDRISMQVERQGHRLLDFSIQYKTYRQKKQEIESDPQAPQGFSALFGKTLAKVGLEVTKQIPGGSIATSFIDEDTITEQASEWTAYVARKISNKDEVLLIQEPLKVLTPLFLKDLSQVAEKADIALFFDTYERTSSYLDEWLRDIFSGCYGDLPINLIVVIAGREGLDKSSWSPYESSLRRIFLTPFTDQEAKEYLAMKGIRDKQVIDTIIRLSNNLPLLIATLAVKTPDNPHIIEDPSDTAVERFLKWTDRTDYRQAAIDMALPKVFNRDIVALVSPDNSQVDDLFQWLKKMPFVRKHVEGWTYHDVARAQMLRHKRIASPQEWISSNKKLADGHETLLESLEPDKRNRYESELWQNYSLRVLYHRLLQSPEQYIKIALNEFSELLKTRQERAFGARYAQIIQRAGKDLESSEIQRWGEQLSTGIEAYNGGQFKGVEKMLTTLIKHSDILPPQKSVVIGLRGEIYRFLGRYEEAIENLDQALKINPNDAYSIADRAETWRLLGEHEKSIVDFSRAIELKPDYSWALAGRGSVYSALERHEEALRDLDEAIEIDSEHAYNLITRGAIRENIGQYEKAMEDIDCAVSFGYKDSNWAIYRRGLCLIKFMPHKNRKAQ